MTIHEIKKQQGLSKTSSSNKKSTSSVDFFSLLDGQLNPTEEISTPSDIKPAEVTPQVPARLRLKGLTLSENTINLLESYEKALANLDLKADDLAPLIEAMEGDTTALLDIKEQLASEDPLAQLIDQVATITYIESEKYRRGDYHAQ